MKVLVVDVGGHSVKVGLAGRKGGPVRIPSGEGMTAARMAVEVKKATRSWSYDVVSIGYPGPVANGRPSREPANLGRGWTRFDYRQAFGRPVCLVNDAAMQALGSYEGGRMLFMGLGTGLGSALVLEDVIAPLELAHLPYRKGRTYEDYAGERGLKRMGPKKWTKHVHAIVEILRHGLQCEYVVLGGGQAKRLASLPRGVVRGDNAKAIVGGIRLWEEEGPHRRRRGHGGVRTVDTVDLRKRDWAREAPDAPRGAPVAKPETGRTVAPPVDALRPDLSRPPN